MYDPRTDLKYDAAKHSLFKVGRMLQHLQRIFELYYDPAQDLSIDKKTIGFQGRHEDNIHIMFKASGDGLQADDVCNCGYTYSFIY